MQNILEECISVLSKDEWDLAMNILIYAYQAMCEANLNKLSAKLPEVF